MYIEVDYYKMWISLLISFTFLILGALFLAYQSNLAKNKKVEHDRSNNVLLLITIYFFFFFMIISLGIIWTYDFNSKVTNVIPSSGNSQSKFEQLYNSRTLLGYVEGITFTEISFFLPLLIVLWSNSQQKIVDFKRHLIELQWKEKEGIIDHDRLDKKILEFEENSENIEKAGNEIQVYFYISLGVIALFLGTLAYSNFATIADCWLYIIIIWQKISTILLLLWFIMLFVLFQYNVNHYLKNIKPYDFELIKK